MHAGSERKVLSPGMEDREIQTLHLEPGGMIAKTRQNLVNEALALQEGSSSTIPGTILGAMCAFAIQLCCPTLGLILASVPFLT